MASASEGLAGGALSVEELLRAAYGEEEFGKTGHRLAGHEVIAEADVASAYAQGQGSSLLYGELLPEGAAQLPAALLEGRPEEEEEGRGPLLELGMGTGKVALQLFLALRRDVYGVELAPSRWSLADAAVRRLSEAAPGRFRYSAAGESLVRLEDLCSGATCELACGSLLDTPAELLARAAAVVMEVCLPSDLQRQACQLLQSCPSGCRVVCYAPLHGLVEGCRLAPVRAAAAGEEGCEAQPCLGDGRGGLCLPASWRPSGHGFAFYELAESAEAAAAAWASAGAESGGGRVEVDASGNPSRARRMKYTDDVLGSPRESYCWGKGDKVLVGFSWLPFLDLGNPGDGAEGGPEGVTWMPARVVSVDTDGFASLCYLDDGTVEERVHPERIRKEGCLEERPPPVIDWGEDD